MKKTVLFSLLAALSSLFSQNMHAHNHYIVEPVVAIAPAPIVVTVAPAPVTYVTTVETAPPAEIEEEMTESPGPNYAWIKGNWQWDGAQWVRVHGRWEARPSAAAVWVPGYWHEHEHHHHVWVGGYWR